MLKICSLHGKINDNKKYKFCPFCGKELMTILKEKSIDFNQFIEVYDNYWIGVDKKASRRLAWIETVGLSDTVAHKICKYNLNPKQIQTMLLEGTSVPGLGSVSIIKILSLNENDFKRYEEVQQDYFEKFKTHNESMY